MPTVVFWLPTAAPGLTAARVVSRVPSAWTVPGWRYGRAVADVVADELNFGRAAARLYLSQPALSRQVSSLERLVGCELLRRSTHRVELTLAGEALLDRARKLLRSLDEAVTATRAIGGELLARANQHWEHAGLGSELSRPGPRRAAAARRAGVAARAV